MKYLHLRMAKHLDKPVNVQFVDSLKDATPQLDRFDNTVYEVESVLLSESYWTAGSKNTEPIEITLGEHFTFVMTETLWYKFVEQSTDNPLEVFEAEMTKSEDGRVMYVINKQIDGQAPASSLGTGLPPPKGSVPIGGKGQKTNQNGVSVPQIVTTVTTQERIAYGQSFNIAVATVNAMYEENEGGKLITDLHKWVEKVEAVANLIYPSLIKNPPSVSDDNDELPF